MNLSPFVPFIRGYVADKGVDLAVLESAYQKRREHGKPAVREHWSPDEALAYSTYKKAREEYRKSDEFRAATLAELEGITPSLKSVTDADFDAVVLNPEVSMLVQFFARWCGPCHEAGAVLEKVAQSGHAIARLDCEASPETARRFAIRSYPTLVLFQRGGLRAVYRGERTPEMIGAWLAGGGKIKSPSEKTD